MLLYLCTVDDVEIDMEGQKVIVTTDKSAEECLEQLKKTGKAVEFVGEVKG